MFQNCSLQRTGKSGVCTKRTSAKPLYAPVLRGEQKTAPTIAIIHINALLKINPTYQHSNFCYPAFSHNVCSTVYI